jgi:hypothetical protein
MKMTKSIHSKKFPESAQAAHELRRSEWEIADALLAEAKPNNLDAVLAELTENGVTTYTKRDLKRLRKAAELFPPHRRHVGIPIRTHLIVRNPDLLDKIVKEYRTIKQQDPWRYKNIERVAKDVMRVLRKERRTP